MIKIVNGVKFYPVSESMKFNLEACHDKLSLMIWDADEQGNADLAEELINRRDEADRLACNAGFGWLSGEDYGKAKELVAWRVEQRIQANMEAGNYKNLAYCY